MKNIKNAKLKLTTDTIRLLDQGALAAANGGSIGPGGSDACPTLNLCQTAIACLTGKTC